jgi:molecular chaperone HtpG
MAFNFKTNTNQNEHIICLLAIPDGYELLIKAIRIVCSDKFYGWEVLRAKDKLLKFNSYQSNLIAHVNRSQCYIVDISDLDPDVMFQAGMMASFHEERPLIFICQKNKVASCNSLLGASITEYDWNGEETNLENLIKQISDGFRRREYLEYLIQYKKYHYLDSEILIYRNLCANGIAKQLEVCYATVEEFIVATVEIAARRIPVQETTFQNVQDELKRYYEIFEDVPDNS